MTTIIKRFVLILSLVFSGAFGLSATADDHQSVGQVDFENAGAEAAQAAFHRGLALLHNFEYSRAADAFQEAQEIDPTFAMAYWGEAMTHNHPVWFEQDREAAISIMTKLGATPDERMAKLSTDREKAYWDALETLYGEGDKEDRDDAYHKKMLALHAAYPDDVDAAAFAALSTLGTAHEGRDFPTYMRSAGILEEYFPDNKNHPGVLHYLIHSYDDAVHSPLGLRAARLYGKVAPDAGHPLHMTSHIFLGLGMWEDVIAANKQAMAVVNRGRLAKGERGFGCGHYNEWLIYGHLQIGDVDNAREGVNACRLDAARELADSPVETPLEGYRSRVRSFNYVANMYVATTGDMEGIAPLDTPAGAYLMSRMINLYSKALVNRSNASVLNEIEAAYGNVRADIKAENPDWRSQRGEAIMLQIKGLNLLASGDHEAGLEVLRDAAELEASLPLAFGPPAIAKPSYELLGEELERLAHYSEALDAYEKALLGAPNRRISAEGSARVASILAK